ncbi:MAG: M28 family peptidase [Candidatus Eisenbacteria bacterium]
MQTARSRALRAIPIRLRILSLILGMLAASAAGLSYASHAAARVPLPPSAGGARAGGATIPEPEGPEEKRLLIVIDSADRSALAPLAASDAPPVQIADGKTLAWAGRRDALEQIRAAGFEARILWERPEGSGARRIATILDPAGRDAGATARLPLASLGEILPLGPRTVVLVHGPADLAALQEQYETLPIPERPIRFAAPAPAKARPPGGAARRLERDPTIAALVDEVDATSLEKHVRMLQDLGPRVSTSPAGYQAAESLAARFRSFGIEDVSLQDYNAWCDNVVAVKPGWRDPDEIYVIGAHYDSVPVSPGADDNGSGTAGVLEAARVLAPEPFEATLIFLCFSGEEQGLHGSAAWAGQAADLALDIRGMVNLDMIGYAGADPDLDLITDPSYPEIIERTYEAIETYLPGHRFRESTLSGGNSDQQSFWNNGYAAIFFFEGENPPNPAYHRSTDRIGIGLNSFPFLRANVQSAVALLASYARPLRVRIEHEPLHDPAIGGDGYPVTAQIFSYIAPLEADSVVVRWRVDGGAWTIGRMRSVDDSVRYSYTIPRQRPGRRVEYAIRARDLEGRAATDPYDGTFSFVVGREALFADSFDADQGWTIGGPEDGATSGLWVREPPVGTSAQPAIDAEGDSSGACFVTGNAPEGAPTGEADVDGGRTTLTSPRIDLAGARQVVLSYSRWFVDGTVPDDSLLVLLSNDDGESWTVLESVRGGDAAWAEVTFHDLETRWPLTDRMRLRFVADDGGSASLYEAAVDDVRLVGVVSAPEPAFSARSRLVGAWPSPLRDDTTILFDMLAADRVRLDLFDVQGRRVAQLLDEDRPAGRHDLIWKGRDEDGRDLPSGVYFLRMRTAGGGQEATLRLLKLR